MMIGTRVKKIYTGICRSFTVFTESEHTKHVRIISAGAITLFIFFVLFYHATFTPPRDFPTGAIVVVEEGMTLDDIAKSLREKSAIRSPLLFKAFVIMLVGDRGSLSGGYFFDIPLSSWQIALRITQGEFGLDPVRVTIPEGFTVADIAETLGEKLPSFNEKKFLELAEGEEGYLFPDTYFFLPNVRPEQILRDMKDNFSQKTAGLYDTLEGTVRTPRDIVIMASILEKEAITAADKKIVAGILWKRLDIGMPLQVDAPFAYVIDRNTYELTMDDLASDSPYNTYKYKGLPAGPIANPGLESILAALMPEESPYLFYLSDRRNGMHYSATFEGHKRNRILFLN